MEKYGAFQLLVGLIVIVVVGVFTKIHFEGPSCPSSERLTGTFFSFDAYSTVKQPPLEKWEMAAEDSLV